MTRKEFTHTRISVESLERLEKRAIRNHRSMTQEIDFLLETVDAMEATGVRMVQVMPGPKGSVKIPIVTMEAQEPA